MSSSYSSVVDNIKLDVDEPYFSKWLRDFTASYALLYAHGKLRLFTNPKVYKTLHGWHVYLTTGYPMPYATLLLIECVLTSDRLKQLYAYAEGSDVLFKRKSEQNSEVLDDRATAALRLAIYWVAQNTFSVVHAHVRVPL